MNNGAEELGKEEIYKGGAKCVCCPAVGTLLLQCRHYQKQLLVEQEHVKL